jgi:hypothetical protein
VKVPIKDGCVVAKSEKDSRQPGRLAAIASEFEMDDLEEEMDAATPEEREKILEREGWTREEMRAVRARTRAKLKAKLAELEKAAPAEPPAETPAVTPASTQGPPAERSNVIELSTRRRIIRWAAGSGLAGGIALAAAFLGVFLNATDQHITEIKPPVTGAGTGPGNWDLSDPFVMRYEGFSFCAVEDYEQCLVWLDRAYAKDPTGENAWPRAQIARKHAMDALAAQRDH